MKTIWKFPLPKVTPFVAWLPEQAEILCVQTQGDSPCIWAIVDSDATKENRVFHIVGTGREVPPGAKQYIDTFQKPPSSSEDADQTVYVFHLFENTGMP